MDEHKKISTADMEEALGLTPQKPKKETKKPRTKRGFMHWFKVLFVLGFLGGCMGALMLAFIFVYYAFQVPDFRTLADYKPLRVTKVYANNGELIAEYARERRIYTPISEVPESLVSAFLAAEDADFFNHDGYDLKGIIRAAVINTFTNRKQGASTITQQVAKTFLLSSERTYKRKIKELILSRRIEKHFTKEEILELYLNQIYLGNGAYGVAAAAITYYDKSLDELSIGQQAMIAGLPKAPSRYNPLRNPRYARWRRDVILGRMRGEGFITAAEAASAVEKDLELNPRPMNPGTMARHFSEHVRRHIVDTYGNEALYTSGLSIHTTLDPKMQGYAEQAVLKGAREYDKRHGFRGPIGKIRLLMSWQDRIDEEASKLEGQQDVGVPAAVLEILDDEKMATLGLPGGEKGFMPLESMTWARKYIDADTLGPKVQKVSDVVSIGDIVMVAPMEDKEPIRRKLTNINRDVSGTTIIEEQDVLFTLYGLEQVPKVQASLVALDAHTGAVLAMVGGLGSGKGFNRAVQAKRQAGSAFKPFVYSLAMDQGMTPASIVLDAPVVLRTGEMDEKWKPHNYSEKVYGPSTLRRGLEKSRNLMTIRLAQKLGISNIIDYSRKFGLTGELNRDLSTALGSGSFSLMELTSAYSVFPNQGKRSEPFFISRIQDAAGNTIFRAHSRCDNCTGLDANARIAPPLPSIPQEDVIPATTAYLMTSMLEGVVKHGTAWRARSVGKPVGAKTGTTNDYIDAWLMGFSPDVAIGVWVGFDTPQTLGKNETGSSASAPIWTYFATDALAKSERQRFDTPEGITFVKIDAETGGLPSSSTQKRIIEAFVDGTEPTRVRSPRTPVIDNEGVKPAQLYQGIY